MGSQGIWHAVGQGKNKKDEKDDRTVDWAGRRSGDMVLFIEKHNFFPCSFAFFLVRKWKKQEHLRWPTGPAGGPGDIGFQYF